MMSPHSTLRTLRSLSVVFLGDGSVELPDGMSTLTNITQLVLEQAYFTAMPSCTQSMPQLHCLGLYGHAITSIDAGWFASMRQLGHLDLSSGPHLLFDHVRSLSMYSTYTRLLFYIDVIAIMDQHDWLSYMHANAMCILPVCTCIHQGHLTSHRHVCNTSRTSPA